MIERTLNLLPEDSYPVDEWRIIEHGHHDDLLGRLETIFALSNGYLGIRGSYDEARPAHERGTFVNGFYESWPIVHAEDAYGFAKTGQTIINVPDGTITKLYVDDEPLFLFPGADLVQADRVLDMRSGILERELLWRTPQGKRVLVRSQRLVSLRHRHLAAISWEVTIENASAPVVVSSQLFNHQDAHPADEPEHLDPRKAKGLTHRVLDPVLQQADQARLVLGYQAHNSGMTLACGVEHLVDTTNPYTVTSEATGDGAKVVYIIDAQPAVTFRLTKLLSYHTSRSVPPGELADRVHRTLDRAAFSGFAALATDQRVDFEKAWTRADVRVANRPRVQQAIRWNLFQLIQGTARAEGAGVPAKGLTSQAYEGHYFWDIEIYILPFLIYTQPRIARNLLRFRHSMLDLARQRAREVNQVGALFPWRTINGEEASAYFEAGTAQYHINAAVIHAVKKYVEVTGDDGFLVDTGAELLLSTARLWLDLGFHSPDGAFHIHGVTGPDEYTTVVNDNTYTNLMAQLHLHYAVDVVDWLAEHHPERHRALVDKVGFGPDEAEAWRAAADAMFVPYDDDLGINPQDTDFLQKELWDFAATPLDKYPLLLNYHPLVIYRYQVIKQADVVLAMFLRGDSFNTDQKRRNFDYYDPLTTGDSSLSAGVQSIVAAEVGYPEQSLDYFRQALFTDLSDLHGNAADGVHLASTGAVWMNLVYGFAGLRDYNGQLSFDPRLPADWPSLAFSLTVSERLIDVEITHEQVSYHLRDGNDIAISVRGNKVKLTAGDPVTIALGPAERAGVS